MSFYSISKRRPGSRPMVNRLKASKTRDGLQPLTIEWERRAADAGIETKIGCHTFRATGITDYLSNGGKLEIAQRMAGHSDPRTTKLYERRKDLATLSEIERRIAF